MVPITMTQPLTLTHWNSTAPQNVIGRRPSACPGAIGSDMAIQLRFGNGQLCCGAVYFTLEAVAANCAQLQRHLHPKGQKAG